MRTPGSKDLFPLRRRKLGEQSAFQKGMPAALSLPATASAGWKESGDAEELLHLGPTRPAFSSPCHACRLNPFGSYEIWMRRTASRSRRSENNLLPQLWPATAFD